MEAGGVASVSADLAIDLDGAAHDNHNDLAAVQSVLELLAKDECEGQALTELVRTGGRARGPSSSELVQHPVFGGIEALQMLSQTTLEEGLMYQHNANGSRERGKRERESVRERGSTPIVRKSEGGRGQQRAGREQAG